MKTHKRTASIITAIAVALSVFLTAAPRAEALTYGQAYSWAKMPGSHAKDIAFGANNSVFIIAGGTKHAGGYNIHKWNPSAYNWSAFPGHANRIAADPNGNPWIVTLTGSIYRWAGGKWVGLPTAQNHKAWDIGIGATGKVWIVAGPTSTALRHLRPWNGTSWSYSHTYGKGVQVSADKNGNPCAVRYDGTIHCFTSGLLPGSNAKDISLGAKGHFWMIAGAGAGSKVHRWTGSAWEYMSTTASRIAVAADTEGTAWVTKSDGSIWRGVPGKQVPDVHGKTTTEAAALLASAGKFTTGSQIAYTSTSSLAQMGRVASTNPAKGDWNYHGGAVTLNLYRLDKTPNFYAQKVSAVVPALQAAGFKTTITYELTDTTSAVGKISTQSPIAGQSLAPGTTFALTVYQLRKVPNVGGMNFLQAKSLLEKNGYKPGFPI